MTQCRNAVMTIALALLCLALCGCLNSLWTGANLIYDRHNVYKKVGDFQLGANASRALYRDAAFKCEHCVIDIAVFNGDILLAGHVPTKHLRQEALNRMKALNGYRRIFNQLSVQNSASEYIEDSWITAKIRARILADAKISPNRFKVITSDNVVYLMGDVIPEQAQRVTRIARECAGAKKIVKVFQYYHLSPEAKDKKA